MPKHKKIMASSMVDSPPPPLELSLPHHSDMSSQHHFKKKLTSNADFV